MGPRTISCAPIARNPQIAEQAPRRPFGAPEADVAAHWWTLDNPANHWFGVGSVARAVLPSSELPSPGGDVSVALGVAEVITPDTVQNESRPLIKELVVRLARAGVTATCSRPSGTRYGWIDLDSNLPDFRIALGGPSEEIGHKVAAALVGTFLGILRCYGLVGPIAANMSKAADEERAYLNVLKVLIISFLKGTAPIMAVEAARRAIPGHVRPTFTELEQACRGGDNAAAATPEEPPATDAAAAGG